MRRAEYGAVITAVVFVMAMAGAGIWFGLEEVWHRMLTLNPMALAGLLGLSLVNYLMRAWRWYIYSQHLDIQVSRRRTGLYYFAGFAMTTTPGKLGEALRLWFLERCHGYRYERTAPLLLGDRMGDAVAIVLLCLAGISAFGAAYVTGTLIAAGVLLVALLMLLRPHVPLRAVLLVYGMVGRWPRLFGAARGVVRKTSRLLDPADLRADVGHGRHRLAVRGFRAVLAADRPRRRYHASAVDLRVRLRHAGRCRFHAARRSWRYGGDHVRPADAAQRAGRHGAGGDPDHPPDHLVVRRRSWAS